MEGVLLGAIVVSVSVSLTASECHCNTTRACTVFPSAPCSQIGSPDRCHEGWFGPYCQKQNVALGRPSTQSSTYIGNTEKTRNLNHAFQAHYGVDGRATTSFYSTPLTCTHTAAGDQHHTWTVYLNTSSTDRIQHIRLYLRDDRQDRSNGMEILVGSQMCYNWSSTEHPPPIANVSCRQPLTGNNVTIRVPGGFDLHLTLCEMQIFVCSDGWFGTDCDKQCRCLNNTGVCDKITGQCLGGCAPGNSGMDCQTPCPDGRYGANCASQCGHCLDTDVCDKMTGKCPRGCLLGWSPDLCSQSCQDGSYGINCSSQCGNCLNGDTGTCPSGCAQGWTTDTCLSSCPDGRYGASCASQCGHCLDTDVCDKMTGKCPRGCLLGWSPDLCSQSCQDGSYGINCSSQCGNCLNGDVCAKTTGTCPSGCAPGWTTDTCLSSCQDGSYGINCSSQCGNCLNGDVCAKTTGTCPRGCASGWTSDTCLSSCSDGRHGYHCQSECGQCKGNLPCNKINGTCDQGCQPGFQEPTCKGCVDGMYGDDCMSRCGQCKDALTCDRSSGECPEGCQGNFMKPLCQVCLATPGCLSREAPVVATFGTLLVLAVIALLTSIFYIRRLKRQLSASQKKPEDNYISLDEKTRDPATESTYEDIDNTSPYVQAGEVH